MSFAGLPPESTEDDDLSPVLDNFGAMPLPLRSELDAYGLGVRERAARLEKEYNAPRRALYEKYGKELEARRAGPSSSERLYEIGAAFLKPKMSPGFGGTIANLAPVLAGQRKAIREAEDAKSAMLTKYKMDVGELQGDELKTNLASEDKIAAARYAALKAMYTPRMVQAVDEATGNLVWRMVSPADMQQQAAGAPTPGAPSPVRVNNDTEFNALPSGAMFIGPDNVTRRKP